MITKTIDSFGGISVDRKPVKNPTSEVSAAQLNRLKEDVAQLTHAPAKSVVRFKLGSAATVSPSDISVRSVWGDGDAQKPVITRSASGKYALTWATSYTDSLSYVEAVSLFDADGRATCSGGGTPEPLAVDVYSVSGRVVSLIVSDYDGTALGANDTGPVSGNAVYCTVWAY